MQRSLMTKQHSKQFLLIRNRDVAIRHNIEAYLIMSCQMNNIKITQVCSNILDLESQAKTKVLFHETKYCFLKRNFCFKKQNFVSRNENFVSGNKNFVSRNEILFQKNNAIFIETR